MLTAETIGSAYVLQIAELESGGNTLAYNRISGASGLYGFLYSTWEGLRRTHPELHLKPTGRTDPLQATRAFRAFTADNARVLERITGRTPTYSQLALAHFAGAGGASALLRASPDASVGSVLGAGVVRANPQLRKMTVGGLIRFYAGRVPDFLPQVIPARQRVARIGRGSPASDVLNENELLRLRGLADPLKPEGNRPP